MIPRLRYNHILATTLRNESHVMPITLLLSNYDCIQAEREIRKERKMYDLIKHYLSPIYIFTTKQVSAI